MIRAGIIGLGPVWESRYQPAIQALSSRVRIAAVYDAVEERSCLVADKLKSHVALGIQTISRRSDVDACLILGKDWTNLPALRFLCEARKPAYIAGSLGHEIPAIGEIHMLALSEGLTFVPEFSRRYTPATFRLKELIATKLGTPHKVVIQARLPQATRRDLVPGQAEYQDFLIGLFDWCLHLLPGQPRDILTLPLTSPNPRGHSIQVRFDWKETQPTAEFQLIPTVLATDELSVIDLEPGEVRAEVHCEAGIASIGGISQINWSHGNRDAVEALTEERSDAEVMLDHFFRRVVGGLIPVADLSDICRAINLFRAYEGSKVVQKRVKIPGQFGRSSH